MDPTKKDGTMLGWRATDISLPSSRLDIDLVDTVLSLIPELRVVAEIGQMARNDEVVYPIESKEALLHLMSDKEFALLGHRIDKESASSALQDECFPICHEGEFVSAIYTALVRCKFEAMADRHRGRRGPSTDLLSNGPIDDEGGPGG